MAGLTKKDLKDLVKEAVKETLSENTFLKEMISECIKTSVLTILQEVNNMNSQTLEIEESRERPQTMLQEKPLVTAASKTRVNRAAPPAPQRQQPQEGAGFTRSSMMQMFEEEFGPNLTNVMQSSSNPAKINMADMIDTAEDDPRVLKALGIR